MENFTGALGMRRLGLLALLFALLVPSPRAAADACGDTVDEYNSAVDKLQSWFSGELQREFGVSQWADIPWAEDNACARVLPIYREQFSRHEEIISLDQASRRICGSRVHNVGSGVSTAEVRA